MLGVVLMTLQFPQTIKLIRWKDDLHSTVFVPKFDAILMQVR